jgi:hypothetical protein
MTNFASSLWAPGTVVLSREELYERVWETPLSRLAIEFGVSNSGLAKICERNAVPRPKGGYWNRKHKGRKPALPPCDEPRLRLIPIRQQEAQATEAEFDIEIRELLDRVRCLPQVRVPSSLHKPHPVVRIAEKQRRDPGDNLSFDSIMKVSPSQGKRAARFLNCLVKTTESMGGRVQVEASPRRGQQAAVYLCGERVTSVRVREICRRVRANEDRYRRTEHEPTGSLVVDSGPSCNRIFCRDTEKAKIEEGINQTIIAWLEELGRKRIQRLRRMAEDRERQERAHKALELREQQDAERKKVDDLLADAAAWEQSRILRSYITAVEAGGQPPSAEQEVAGQWIGWAKAQADRLDPLTASPPSVDQEGAVVPDSRL